MEYLAVIVPFLVISLSVVMVPYLVYRLAGIWGWQRGGPPELADGLVVPVGALGPGDQLTPVAVERLEVALELYRKRYAPKLVVCGGRGMEAAAAGAAFIQQRGIPERDVVTVSAGPFAHHHAVEVKRVAERYGLRRVTVVTSSLLALRMTRLFQRQGFDRVACFPVRHQQMRPAVWIWYLREVAWWCYHDRWVLLGLMAAVTTLLLVWRAWTGGG